MATRGGLFFVAAFVLGSHLAPLDGSEPGTDRANRLIHESSPYLRLHAYNPVDWYPWGEEALATARRENKVIFLSVGYSTCYWCHVMERKVFSNPKIAALMNADFINIKVDREERPEIDEIYMTATQLLTGRGGWPNSVFLTPDLEPFFAGTYFPPEDALGRPGFTRVLTQLSNAWIERPDDVRAQAAKIADAIRQTVTRQQPPASSAPSRAVAEQAVAQLASRYDATNGGFGGAPKFPSPSNLFLLWDVAEAGDAEARRMVVETLTRMGRGAIYDQLDGGFHRYTLDAAWRTPHFEKMLYDNAHLAELLAVVGAATGDVELERLAHGTFDFILDWMTLDNGAFKSAIDAETDAVEGAYYIWTAEELRSALGDRGFELLAPIFGFAGEPNFEHDHYTLYLTDSLGAHAERLEIPRSELLTRLEPELEKLRRVRGEREFPLVDDKVLTDWNGMMITALARGGQALGEERYVAAAAKAAEFVLGLQDPDGTQLHAWRNGEAKIPAFLDDYSFLVRALLALEDATGEKRWLAHAERLTTELDRRLGDPNGGYFMSAPDDSILFRVKSATDGAIPSGNAIAALNNLRLAERRGDPEPEAALASLKAFSSELERIPGAHTTLSRVVWRIGASPANTATALTAAPDSSAEVERLAHEVVEAQARLTATSVDGWQPFRIELTLRDGWHVNANPATLDFLIPTKIEGDVREVTYPPGETLEFEFAEEAIAVYSNTTLAGEAPPGADSVALTYQACDDSRCLPPVTVSLPLD